MSNLRIDFWYLPQYGRTMIVRIIEPSGKQHAPPISGVESLIEWDASFMEKYVEKTVDLYHEGKLIKSGILKYFRRNEKGFWEFEVDD